MNRIQELRELGQSIWLDYIERSMIADGQLQALVDAGLGGVTSNPTIFQQAITGSKAYEDDLKTLVASGKDAKAIFESLAIEDIRAAADVLRPVYDATNSRDGYVSMEVAPDLAYDTEGTIAEARRLFKAIDRPNVMIKVPATEPGLAAIRQLIHDGININVTLIFALDRYSAVKDAYISGLADRLAEGKNVDAIASVASFFISRIDTSADGALEKIAKEHPEQAATTEMLMGKIAIANAKLAYRQFQQVFSSDRWLPLEEAGAQVQRPLWASTSTKNPAYPELLYVETLIGPHTVNTMPPKTLDAYRDHGQPARAIDQNVTMAENELARLEALDISLAEITDFQEKDGVKKFADSFTDLLDAIAKRQAELEETA
ncbi:MAG: transaldolase [Litorilinea sp.]